MGWQRPLNLHGYEVIADAITSPHVHLRIAPHEIERMSDEDMTKVFRTFAAIAPEIGAIGTARYTNFDTQFLSPDDLDLIVGSNFATEKQKEKARLCLAFGFLPKRERGIQPGAQPKVRPGYVYLLQSGPYHKIGISQDVDRRIEQLATLPPFDIELICTIETEDMYTLESELHVKFRDKQINGEWFRLDVQDVRWLRTLAGGID